MTNGFMTPEVPEEVSSDAVAESGEDVAEVSGGLAGLVFFSAEDENGLLVSEGEGLELDRDALLALITATDLDVGLPDDVAGIAPAADGELPEAVEDVDAMGDDDTGSVLHASLADFTFEDGTIGTYALYATGKGFWLLPCE